MIYKIIIAYLLGIVIQINFGLDFYLFLFIVLMSFTGLLIYQGYSETKSSKGHLKDMVLALFLCCVLYAGALLAKARMQENTLSNFTENLYNVEGKIVDIDMKPNGTRLTISVEKIENLNNPQEKEIKLKLLNLDVSGLNSTELYDNINLVGQIQLNNFEVFYERKPMAFSYEYEKLFYNTPYSVSYPKKISITNSDKNLFHKFRIALAKINERLKSAVSDNMSEPYAGIAEGLVLGQQENIIKEIKDIFRTSGLIHILVLSGANISFIIGICWYVLRNIKIRIVERFRLLILLSFSWVFIFTTGLHPPSVRAGVMATGTLLAQNFGRNYTTLYSLLFSLAVLTLINPLTLIYSASLHLSFLACIAIFITGPQLEKYLSQRFNFLNKHKFICFYISTFISIFIFTTPYILALVGSASIFGTLLTFLVEPFVLLSTIFTFLTILSSFISSHIASIFGLLNTLSVKVILYIAETGANNLPMLSISISKNFLILYYFLLISFGLLTNKEETDKERILI
jgi:ComEC/Rec2-related protein